jgi:hypothetical protein
MTDVERDEKSDSTQEKFFPIGISDEWIDHIHRCSDPYLREPEQASHLNDSHRSSPKSDAEYGFG